MTEFGTDPDYKNLISIKASTNDLVVFYPSISKFMYITCTFSSSSPRLPSPLPLNPRIWPCIALGCILPSLLRIGISCKDRRNNLCGISPNRRATSSASCECRRDVHPRNRCRSSSRLSSKSRGYQRGTLQSSHWCISPAKIQPSRYSFCLSCEPFSGFT